MKTIEQSTPLIPYLVAEFVLANHKYELDELGPLRVAFLNERAEHCWQKQPHFRKLLKSMSNREWLVSFMAHWIEAEQKKSNSLFVKNEYPLGYMQGRGAS